MGDWEAAHEKCIMRGVQGASTPYTPLTTIRLLERIMATTDSTKILGIHFNKEFGAYRIDFNLRHNGTRIRRTRLLPRGMSADEARLILDSMRANAMREITGLAPVASGWSESIVKARGKPKSWFYTLYSTAKSRAKRKQRAFSLTHDDLTKMLLRSEGKCEVTGVCFRDRVIGSARMRPLIPSIDRKDWTAGYTMENCRIVCVAVNIAMFNWGEDLFKSLAIGYVVNQVIAPHALLFHVGGGQSFPRTIT